MWPCKNKCVEKNEFEGKSRTQLESEIHDLKNELDGYKNLLAQINADNTKCTPMLDFDIMRVFSIERNVSNNRPCTVVGYYMQEPVVSSDGEMIVMQDVVKEWTMYCNNELHEELVKKFIAWKAKK